MSKNLIMLTGLLVLGSVGISQAHPLDSPDIVYIDGLPCNSACQSYMAWSRRTSSVSRHAAPVESPVESRPAKAAREKPALRPAKRAVSRVAAVVHRASSKPAKPDIAKRTEPLRAANVATPQPAGDAAVKSEPAPPSIEAPPSADGATAASKTRTVQEQVAAAT